MFTKCSNPACKIPFDYREGQLVRLCRSVLNGRFTANKPVVEHFWLCGSCSELYVLSQESGNIQLKPRDEELAAKRGRSLIAAA